MKNWPSCSSRVGIRPTFRRQAPGWRGPLAQGRRGGIQPRSAPSQSVRSRGPRRARAWFEKAAAAGHAGAMRSWHPGFGFPRPAKRAYLVGETSRCRPQQGYASPGRLLPTLWQPPDLASARMWRREQPRRAAKWWRPCWQSSAATLRSRGDSPHVPAGLAAGGLNSKARCRKLSLPSDVRTVS